MSAEESPDEVVRTLFAGATRTSFSAEPVDTQVQLPAEGPGTNWLSGHVWHIRGAEVQDSVVGDLAGSLDRRVSFNLDLATGHSTAWCSFTWHSTVDSWAGTCRGSLLAGTLQGHGTAGTMIQGRYELAPGGIPAVGPYRLTGDILAPGS